MSKQSTVGGRGVETDSLAFGFRALAAPESPEQESGLMKVRDSAMVCSVCQTEYIAMIKGKDCRKSQTLGPNTGLPLIFHVLRT